MDLDLASVRLRILSGGFPLEESLRRLFDVFRLRAEGGLTLVQSQRESLRFSDFSELEFGRGFNSIPITLGGGISLSLFEVRVHFVRREFWILLIRTCYSCPPTKIQVLRMTIDPVGDAVGLRLDCKFLQALEINLPQSTVLGRFQVYLRDSIPADSAVFERVECLKPPTCTQTPLAPLA